MLSIHLATNADRQKWDDYVLNHPKGLAYQLYAWKEAVERAYGFECPYFMAQEDGVVRGVFPLARIHLPFCKGNLVSLPYCDAGGILADDINRTRLFLARNGHPYAVIDPIIRPHPERSIIDLTLAVSTGPAVRIEAVEFEQVPDSLVQNVTAGLKLGPGGLFKDREAWTRLMTRGMKEDFSWGRSAKRYIEIYRSLVRSREPESRSQNSEARSRNPE